MAKATVKRCAKCADYRSVAAAYQDEKYGPGTRVHNACGGKGGGKCRCTVCGDVKGL
jgi:hypothetical protein